MQRRGERDPFFDFGDPFSSFGGHRSLMSSFFGERDPFDDPFFLHPFGSTLESRYFGSSGNPFVDAHASGFLEGQPSQPNSSRGPIIEELNSDDEKEESENVIKNNSRKHAMSNKEHYVEEPDDEHKERNTKPLQVRSSFDRLNNMQSEHRSHSFTFQSAAVTYDGGNGAYYTSSRTRRTGSDGLTFEECKEADSTTGQATHRVSRGIHEKGHSLTRKLGTFGKVGTMQTLHNLNEDELPGFEEAWKGSTRRNLPGWSEGFNPQDGIGSRGTERHGPASRGTWALPSTERSHSFGGMRLDTGNGAVFSCAVSSGRMKPNAEDGTRSSWGRLKAAKNSKDPVRGH